MFNRAAAATIDPPVGRKVPQADGATLATLARRFSRAEMTVHRSMTHYNPQYAY